MRDVELYRTLLGLAPPWTVVSVELDVTAQRVVVKVDAGAGPFACPECGAAGPRYDRKARQWRHLDTMQFTTWIEADVPDRRAAYGESVCAVRGGGGWRRTHEGTAPVLDPTSSACSTNAASFCGQRSASPGSLDRRMTEPSGRCGPGSTPGPASGPSRCLKTGLC